MLEKVQNAYSIITDVNRDGFFKHCQLYQATELTSCFTLLKSLLQIQPELITLNPMDILHVNRPSKKGASKGGQNDDDEDDEVRLAI